MAEIYVGYVDVDIDLAEFDTDELIEELERRNETYTSNSYVLELIKALYEKRRNSQDYNWELDEIIHQTIGRVS